MKLTLSWLKEFAPLRGTADDVAADLAALGLPVEEQTVIGVPVPGVITARIVGVRAHPTADRIRLADVDPGDGQILQICCGAPNLNVGDVVPLATIGTEMPNGMAIAARKMRGEDSHGMLCSAREVGLGDDSQGLLELDPDTPLGVDLFEALGLVEDVVFDLDVTPNRPEALSVAGVARDLAARQGVPFNLPVAEAADDPSASPADSDCAVTIVDTELCGRFTVREISGIAIGQSPGWMAQRLQAAGMRPINNVVDVSNFVMLELGQPSHAFDADKVAGGQFTVRPARQGERLVTLDDKERTLDAADGVIADSDDVAMALAGVMGGAATEISESTTRIFVEMAWWHPVRVDATVTRHRLHSEASLRFRRGSDPEVYPLAMRRFAQLLAQTCPVKLHPGTVVAGGDLPQPATVAVRPERVTALIGYDISAARIGELLRPIGFTVGAPDSSGVVNVAAPSFRPDVTTEVDVVEEVARHFGYDRLEPQVPRSPLSGALSPRQRARRMVHAAATGAGYDEAMPMPFLAPGELAAAGLPDGPRLANPLAAEESVMRTSLMPGLLRSLAHNVARKSRGARLFEIGHMFEPGELIIDPPASVAAGRVLSGEREMFAAVASDGGAAAAVDLLERILGALGFGRPVLEAGVRPGLHPGRSASVLIDGGTVGSVGEVHPSVATTFEAGDRIGYVELDLDSLLSELPPPRQAAPVSRFPAAEMDLAFVVDESVTSDAVHSAITGADALVADASLFDVYRGDSLGANAKSLAYSVRLQSVERTLNEDEVATARSAVIAAVASATGGTLRS